MQAVTTGISTAIGIGIMAFLGGPVGWIAGGALLAGGAATVGSLASNNCL